MIRPLRRIHLLATAALAIVLPPLVAAALLLRPDAPPLQALPGELVGRLVMVPPGSDWMPLAGELPVRAMLAPSGRQLMLDPQGPSRSPDVLVYWSASATAPAAELPGDALLLGTLGSGGRQSFELPAQAAGQQGLLILYSLAHRRPVAWAATVRDGA